MRIQIIQCLMVMGLFVINIIFAGTLNIEQNPFQYSQAYTDHESALQYLNARYYDAKSMRFISRDSFRLLNRYTYADGNPILNADPSGHFSFAMGAVLLTNSIGLISGFLAPFVASNAIKIDLGTRIAGSFYGVAAVVMGIAGLFIGPKFVSDKKAVALVLVLGLSSMLTGITSLGMVWQLPEEEIL